MLSTGFYGIITYSENLENEKTLWLHLKILLFLWSLRFNETSLALLYQLPLPVMKQTNKQKN
jgi:hypothetical protein